MIPISSFRTRQCRCFSGEIKFFGKVGYDLPLGHGFSGHFLLPSVDLNLHQEYMIIAEGIQEGKIYLFGKLSRLPALIGLLV